MPEGQRYPTWKQLYALCATLCEKAGLEPPRDAKGASTLLESLRALPEPTNVEVPF